MTDPVESALRTMLRERSGDITEVSGAALDLDHPGPGRPTRPHRPCPRSHRERSPLIASDRSSSSPPLGGEAG